LTIERLMAGATFLICRNPTASHWAVGRAPIFATGLILLGAPKGLLAAADDLPSQASRALAGALTTVGRVTFPCSATSAEHSEWAREGDDYIAAWPPPRPSPLGAAIAFLKGHRATALFSTIDPEAALRLFDDAAFPWQLQGQCALISPRIAPPPALHALPQTVEDLVGPTWTRYARRLTEAGVEGVLRPGVDGDVGGLFAFTNALAQAFDDAVERECTAAGLECWVLDEGAFTKAMAG
jgi:hypothetical protein